VLSRIIEISESADRMMTFSRSLSLSLSLLVTNSFLSLPLSKINIFFGADRLDFERFFFKKSHGAAILTCSLGLIPGSRFKVSNLQLRSASKHRHRIYGSVRNDEASSR